MTTPWPFLLANQRLCSRRNESEDAPGQPAIVFRGCCARCQCVVITHLLMCPVVSAVDFIYAVQWLPRALYNGDPPCPLANLFDRSRPSAARDLLAGGAPESDTSDVDRQQSRGFDLVYHLTVTRRQVSPAGRDKDSADGSGLLRNFVDCMSKVYQSSALQSNFQLASPVKTKSKTRHERKSRSCLQTAREGSEPPRFCLALPQRPAG
jgi:hypothetical protein